MHAQISNIRPTKHYPLNKNMDTTISTPIPINSIYKKKESDDVISSENTVTDTLTPSLSPFLSSYKEIPGLHTHHTYVDCQSITGKIGTDQKSRFAVPSFSGNNYLLILFDFDNNSIFSKPIPNRTKHSSKNAHANILKYLQTEDSNLNCTDWTMNTQIISKNS